jgi:hypothetical protein
VVVGKLSSPIERVQHLLLFLVEPNHPVLQLPVLLPRHHPWRPLNKARELSLSQISGGCNQTSIRPSEEVRPFAAVLKLHANAKVILCK